MQQRPVPSPPVISAAVAAWLRKPQFLIPAGVVVVMIIVAFGVQPGGAEGQTQANGGGAQDSAAASVRTVAPTPTMSPLQPTASGAASAAAQAQATGQATGAAGGPARANTAAPSSDVAGVRATAQASPTPQADLSRQSNQCGSMKETATGLSIEQTMSGISVKATRAAAYPIEYFRCILMATGTQESFSLASSVSKAQSAGMTTIVLLDLWITNAGRDFGQVNLKDSMLAAAGQTFAPLATLGGRAEVVVSSGQGRNVTLVVALKNTVGDTIGPMTLTLPAPLAGGQQTAGKYQLFLPTP